MRLFGSNNTIAVENPELESIDMIIKQYSENNQSLYHLQRMKGM